jgi:ribosome maturation protein Sdo1
VEKSIDEVLQQEEIYTNVSQGEKANEKFLIEVFPK